MSDLPEYPPFPGASLDHWLTTPPPEDDDPDEGQCSDCSAWTDARDLDEHGRCPRCETAAGLGGSAGCAAGQRGEP